jgi:hypothetical protein
MNQRRRFWRPAGVIVAAVFALAVGGCGSPLDSSVTGTITMDGKPLELGNGTCTVSFYPEAGGPAAQARVAPDGTYALKTGSTQGIRSGKYTVTVVATGPSPKPAPGSPPMPGPLLTPTRYGTKQRSDLRFTIEPGTNRIDIPMKSK